MDTFTPTSWTGHKQNEHVPKVANRGNAPFYLTHSPFQWELVKTGDDVFEWLPTFSKINEMAGVNGVQQTPNGVDSTVTRMKMMEKGHQILEREFGYVARYPSKWGGFYYALKWDVPKIIGTKTFWNHDSDGYNAWRKLLITEGIIDKPEIEVIEMKMSNIETKIERRLKNQHIPEIKKEIDGLYEIKRQMKAAFNLMWNPEPKSKTRKKKGE